MTLDLFDWIKSNKKKKPTRTEVKTGDQPDLFRVDSDDISEVRPKTEILSAIRNSTRRSSIRKL